MSVCSRVLNPSSGKGVWGDTFCVFVCLSRGYYLVTNLIISFTICLYIDVILILILYDAVRQYIVTSLSHQCCSLAATFIYAGSLQVVVNFL